MFKPKINRNNAKYGNPRGQTRKQTLKIKLSLQKPEKFNGKKQRSATIISNTQCKVASIVIRWQLVLI